MKNIVRLKNEVRDIVLDTLPIASRDNILSLIGEDHPCISEIEDLLNEMLCGCMDKGYEVGFQTAVNLMHGKLDFEIEY